jgi:hypothetical protein
MSSCVHDEENLFGIPASERMQEKIAEYKKLLTSAPNGWVTEYYPEKGHSVGGYTMFLTFYADGRVTTNCEIATNVTAQTTDTSFYDVFAEQGPILSFSTYNRVIHYFCDPSSSDIDGKSGDYEFVFTNAVSPDEILLKGKKHGNRLTLRRNVTSPETYYARLKEMEVDAAMFDILRLVVEGQVIDSLKIGGRTMSGDSINLAFAYTPEGIRLYEPLTVNGVTMLHFKWNPENGRYDCIDTGVNACLEGCFPYDFQLQYKEFLGEWEMQYHGNSTSAWSVANVTVSANIKYKTFTLSSSSVFSFSGIELTYDPQKGTVAILNHNVEHDSEGSQVRICSWDRPANYTYAGTGIAGLNGKWNSDENGKRQIFFVDNKSFEPYFSFNGFCLRLYKSDGNYEDFISNAGGHLFSDINLTKKQ